MVLVLEPTAHEDAVILHISVEKGVSYDKVRKRRDERVRKQAEQAEELQQWTFCWWDRSSVLTIPDGMDKEKFRAMMSKDLHKPSDNFMIVDSRSEIEVRETVLFVVATDSTLSGWGHAKDARSLVARPVRDADEAESVSSWMRSCSEFKRVRIVYGTERHDGRHYRPKMYDGDHLHIYDMSGFGQ